MFRGFRRLAGSSLTMKVDGPHAQGRGKMLHYLKKKITLLPEGVLIQPNNSYIPKLISLLKVSGRRGRGLPYHSALEAYNAVSGGDIERLEGEQAALFRPALVLRLYISQDRPSVCYQDSCDLHVPTMCQSNGSSKALGALRGKF